MCIIFVGCAKADATITTSKELNKNLNLLSNTVKRLDTIDNQYLMDNELYSLNNISATPTPHRTDSITLANSYNVIIPEDEISAEKITLQEDLKSALQNEIINRLYCDNNGNCKLCKDTFICDDDGVCNSCNETIICDEFGNCKECKSELNLNEEKQCSNCNTNCNTNSCNNSMSIDTISTLQKISNTNEKLKINNLTQPENTTQVLHENPRFTIDDNSIDDNNYNITDNNNTFDIKNNNLNNTIKSNNIDKDFEEYKIQDNLTIQTNNTNTTEENTQNNVNLSEKKSNNSNENIEQNNTTLEDENINTNPTNANEENNDNSYTIITTDDDNNIVEFFYYSEETFSPDFLKYQPRHIREINYTSANTNLENYMNKLQKLYTMSSDVIEANNVLSNKKETILKNVNETKELNKCILSGNCTPTNNQLTALNNYISDMRRTINNLRNCNGNLSSEINKISSNNTGIVQSLEVTNSNYLRILNQIDTRISYHKNAIATL